MLVYAWGNPAQFYVRRTRYPRTGLNYGTVWYVHTTFVGSTALPVVRYALRSTGTCTRYGYILLLRTTYS